MPQQSPQTAADQDLRSLEIRIDELIRTCDSLKQENRSLKSERASLIDKTETAKNRVEAIIARLKKLESEV